MKDRLANHTASPHSGHRPDVLPRKVRPQFSDERRMRKYVPWWFAVLFVVALAAAKFFIDSVQSAY